ncbi:MAG: hypothetical protein KAI66_07050 [Lentisphaeria bacterium]|nr:hypothetical protein [Lentisphaeria bacterium]
MSRNRLDLWEKALKSVLDKVDEHLEHTYGTRYPLRNNRQSRGTTANSMYDGLFSVEGKFSLGYARKEGPGYTIEVRIATFSHVPEKERRTMIDDVEAILRREVPLAFPGKELLITRDGLLHRIHGDLDLD